MAARLAPNPGGGSSGSPFCPPFGAGGGEGRLGPPQEGGSGEGRVVRSCQSAASTRWQVSCARARRPSWGRRLARHGRRAHHRSAAVEGPAPPQADGNGRRHHERPDSLRPDESRTRSPLSLPRGGRVRGGNLGPPASLVGVTMKGRIHSGRMSPAPEALCRSREEGGPVGGTWVPPASSIR